MLYHTYLKLFVCMYNDKTRLSRIRWRRGRSYLQGSVPSLAWKDKEGFEPSWAGPSL